METDGCAPLLSFAMLATRWQEKERVEGKQKHEDISRSEKKVGDIPFLFGGAMEPKQRYASMTAWTDLHLSMRSQGNRLETYHGHSLMQKATDAPPFARFAVGNMKVCREQ